MSEEEAYNTIKKGVEAINTRPYATKAEYEKVECIKVLLTAYEKEKEKNKESEDKIKTKIEEIDEVLKGQLIEKIRVYFEAQKEVLQSLLEKE